MEVKSGLMPAYADQKPFFDVRSVLAMPLSSSGGLDRRPPLAELRSLKLKRSWLKWIRHWS